MTRRPRPAGGVRLGAAWSLLYIGTSRLGSFGLSVLVARALGPAPAGAFGIALQATTLAAFLGVLNVWQAQAQRLGELDDPVRQRRVVGVALGLVLAGTALTGGALALLAPWIAEGVYHDPALAPVLAWCGPLAMATGLVMWSEGALTGLHRFRTLAAWGAGSSLADLVVSGLAALAGLPALLAARTAVRVGRALAAWRLAGAAIAGTPAPESAPDGAAGPREPRSGVARRLLRFGGLSFVAAAIVVVGQNVLRLLLVRAAGLEEMGHFQVADTIGQALLVVPTAAGIAFLPAVARDHAAGSPLLRASIQRAVRRVTGFNLPLCLGAIVLGPWAVRLIFGEVYVTAGATLQWLAAAYALAGVVSIAGPVLLGRGELAGAIAINLLWFAVLAGTMLLGAGARGAEGAAFALSIAYVAQLVPCAVIAFRRWRLDPGAFVPPVAVTLLLPAMAILALRAWPAAGPLIGGSVLAAAAALFAGWALPELVAARRERREPTA